MSKNGYLLISYLAFCDSDNQQSESLRTLKTPLTSVCFCVLCDFCDSDNPAAIQTTNMSEVADARSDLRRLILMLTARRRNTT